MDDQHMTNAAEHQDQDTARNENHCRSYAVEDPDRLIDHHQVAAMLSLNEDHVRDRITKRPDFPATYRFGGARRWKYSEVVEWREAQRHEPVRRGRRAA